MKTAIGIGASILILLCGCAQEERVHPTSLSAPPSPSNQPQVSSDSSDQKDRRRDLNAIDKLSSRIDDEVRKKVCSEQFFGGFLTNTEQPRLDWKKFKSEKGRSEATGYPDTYMNVWLKQDKILYVTTQRGMTSGVGWREHGAYYFRPNGTLAKFVFTYSSGAGLKDEEIIRYYNSKGKVIPSSASSKGESPKSQPVVYLHTSSLPAHHFQIGAQ